MSPRVVRRQGRPYVVYSLRERAAMELRDRAGEVMRWDARTLALAAVAYPRDLLGMLRARFHAWTALPGDHFHDFQRQLYGEVLRGGLQGHAVVRCVTMEAKMRHPELLDVLPVADAPRIVCDDRAPGGYARPPWIERDVDLSRWWKL